MAKYTIAFSKFTEKARVKYLKFEDEEMFRKKSQEAKIKETENLTKFLTNLDLKERVKTDSFWSKRQISRLTFFKQKIRIFLTLTPRDSSHADLIRYNLFHLHLKWSKNVAKNERFWVKKYWKSKVMKGRFNQWTKTISWISSWDMQKKGIKFYLAMQEVPVRYVTNTFLSNYG